MNVQEGGMKCFLEDVPKDTLVLVKYTSTQRSAGDDPYNQQYQGEQKGWIVTVDGPSNEFIARRELGAEGRYAFTAQVGGEHKICLQTNTGKWFAQGAEFDLAVDIETGVGATDYAEVARLESLSAMEVQLRQLNDAVHEIIGEQLYQKKREMAFRDTSESTNPSDVVVRGPDAPSHRFCSLADSASQELLPPEEGGVSRGHSPPCSLPLPALVLVLMLSFFLIYLPNKNLLDPLLPGVQALLRSLDCG